MTSLVRKAIYTRENEHALIAEGAAWNFHNEETKEHLHALHPYPAKFIPQIPRRAISEYTKAGDLVYDPFAGCGTTLLEASLLGRPSIGSDNNAVAVLIATAKVAFYSHRNLKALEHFSKTFEDSLNNSHARNDLIPTDTNFRAWFSLPVLERMAALKSLILEQNEPIKTLLLALFSSIVVRVSYQDSDTRYARIARQLKPEDVNSTFKARLHDVVARLPQVMVSGRSPARVEQADARKVPFVDSNSVSLIVTSPPYLNAYDYHKYHRQRLHWISDQYSIDFARKREIGGHDRFTRKNAIPDRYFDDMQACFSEWSRVLRKGGWCLLVVGDAIVSKKEVRVADNFVDLIGTCGLILKQRWIRTLQQTKRAFNVRNSRMTHEHVLLFRRQ